MVEFNETYFYDLCQCTLALDINKLLMHGIPEEAKCYSENASNGCHSNVGIGSSSANAVKTYYMDIGTPNLGHRQSILNKMATQVTFCGVGNRNAMRMMDPKKRMYYTGPKDKRNFETIPPPGPIDVEMLPGIWTFNQAVSNNTKFTFKVNGNIVPLLYGTVFTGYIEFIPYTTWTYNTKWEVTAELGEYRYEYAYYTTNCSEDIPDYIFDRMMGRKSEGMTWYLILSYCILAITIVVVILYFVVACYTSQMICIAASIQPSTHEIMKMTITEKEGEVPPEPKKISYL